MLTDIFAVRYEDSCIFKEAGARELRVLFQCFTILGEMRPIESGDVNRQKSNANYWETVHKMVANELGMPWLSEPYYGTVVSEMTFSSTGKPQKSFFEITRDFVRQSPDEKTNPDEFIKTRLSVVEIGLRKLYEASSDSNKFLEALGFGDSLVERTQLAAALHDAASAEVNVRFDQGQFPLHYHNGFIQFVSDEVISREIEQPFWNLVFDPIWENVDSDMKEALDRRDTGRMDGAFHALKALESTLKIVSDKKKLSTGRESGVPQYIDNLAKKGVGWISQWEADVMRSLFSNVRNPLGHGAGNEPKLTLSKDQTEWILESSMSLIKLIVIRFNTENEST